MSTGDEYDDERDHPQAMIDWLTGKDPDVWFEVTQSLNWDNSFRVLDWIISQPNCDRANAVSIFWGADPLYYLRLPTIDRNNEGYQLLYKVLRNWKAGFYKRAELAWGEDHRVRYRDAVANRPRKDDPFAIPEALLGPWRGRKPNVPANLRAENNVVLWDLLAGLGTHVGSRPGTPHWHEQRDPKLQRKNNLARERAAILNEARDNLRFFGRTLPWLALFFVVSVGGAFLLRWINKGVVF